jgi:predicted pyridoxine 5'-phosphate oxidase superfamily flavin-nucleotide-binding protein
MPRVPTNDSDEVAPSAAQPGNDRMERFPKTHLAFSERVLSIQVRRGSRSTYEDFDAAGGWYRRLIDGNLRRFIESQTSAVLATASADGQPHVQHRGGPPGFLRVVDERTIAFADFEGNRQYITQGNLEENPRAQFLFIDYPTRRRIKVFGNAKVIENDHELIRSLMPAGYEAEPSAAIVFTVTMTDGNCPQHIPQRFEAAGVMAALKQRDERIAELERALEQLGQRRASLPE